MLAFLLDFEQKKRTSEKVRDQGSIKEFLNFQPSAVQWTFQNECCVQLRSLPIGSVRSHASENPQWMAITVPKTAKPLKDLRTIDIWITQDLLTYSFGDLTCLRAMAKFAVLFGVWGKPTRNCNWGLHHPSPPVLTTVHSNIYACHIDLEIWLGNVSILKRRRNNQSYRLVMRFVAPCKGISQVI